MQIDVPVEKAYKLLGNGPVVMVSAALDGKFDVMTNAWNCALEKLVVNIPCAAQKDLLLKVGSCHGDKVDKFSDFSIPYTLGTAVKAPLVDGCLAWLECRVIKDPALASYDLVACEVIKATAQDFYFKDNNIVISSDLNQSCIHHAGDDNFYTMGKLV